MIRVTIHDEEFRVMSYECDETAMLNDKY